MSDIAAAPTAPSPAAGPLGVMEKTIAATLAQAPTDPAIPDTSTNDLAPAGEQPRDQTGKFAPKAGSEEAVTAASIPADGDEPVPAEPVIPEGHVAVPALPEDKARGFTVRDKDGEIVPPDLVWELTANGKPRTLSTDKLVSYAQMGVYNAEREQAHQQLQQTHRQTEEKAQSYEQLLRNADEHIGKLLSDPDYLIKNIQAFEARNTPEARQRAAQAQQDQREQQLQMREMGQQANTFIEKELTPACDKILAALPHVSADELGARLLLDVDRYRVNGILNPRYFQQVRDTVSTDLVAWARQVNESRETDKGASAKAVADARAAAEKAAKDAAAKAQKAKRQMSLRPGGQGSPGAPNTSKPTSRRGVEDAVISGTMAAMRGAG